MKRTVLITALVALALALLPALASAASYDVNVYADSADAAVGDGVCDADAATTGAQCSLRAAIETANASAEADEIGFSLVSGSFTLEIGSQLEITNPVSILGCGTLASAPCTGLRAPNTSINAFVVKADDVEIDKR